MQIESSYTMTQILEAMRLLVSDDPPPPAYRQALLDLVALLTGTESRELLSVATALVAIADGSHQAAQ